MSTIRQRLTYWYTVALGVTVVAFGSLLYLERRSSAVRELDQRLLLEAELADRWLTESYSVLGRIVTTDDLRPALDPGISAYLEAVRDYLIVADTGGRVLALSEVARALRASDLEQQPLVELPEAGGAPLQVEQRAKGDHGHSECRRVPEREPPADSGHLTPSRRTRRPARCAPASGCARNRPSCATG